MAYLCSPYRKVPRPEPIRNATPPQHLNLPRPAALPTSTACLLAPQALRLDGCLFPTASLPVLAALRSLHTLTLEVGCWWSHSLRNRRSAGVTWLDLILDNPVHPGEQHGEDAGALGAPDRGPVPTSDPQFLLHEAPWRLGNLCIMADRLQRVELWMEGEVQVGGQAVGAVREAAVRAVCHSVNQLLLQAVEQGNVRLEVRAPVVEWAPPEDA